MSMLKPIKPSVLSDQLIKKIDAGTVKDERNQTVIPSDKARNLTKDTFSKVVDALGKRRAAGNLHHYELSIKNIIDALSKNLDQEIQIKLKLLQGWLQELKTNSEADSSHSFLTGRK